MSPKMPTNDPLSAPFALNLAQSYADMGLAGYNRLAEEFQVAQIDGHTLTDAATTGAITAAMTLAFATELFIKVLHFQTTGIYPSGHNLTALIKALPDKTRSGLESRFNEFAAKKPNLLALKYEMFEGEGPHAPPERPMPRNEIRFDEAVALASPLFVKLRYLYEEVTPGFSAEIDFRCLMGLIESCRLEIDQFEGPGKVTYKQAD